VHYSAYCVFPLYIYPISSRCMPSLREDPAQGFVCSPTTPNPEAFFPPLSAVQINLTRPMIKLLCSNSRLLFIYLKARGGGNL